MHKEETPPSASFDFIQTAMNAMSQARYGEAFTLIEEGISSQVAASSDPRSQSLLNALKVALAYLDFRLREDFGDRWDTSTMPQKQREQLEIRCSFCGETKSDTRQIIAGPDVFICDECIVRCANALKIDSSG
jgi:hypothetical protein